MNTNELIWIEERQIWNVSWFPKAFCELGINVNLMKDVRYTG